MDKASKYNAEEILRQSWVSCFMILGCLLIVMMPDVAFALSGRWSGLVQPNDTPLGSVLCTISDFLLGNAGKGLATIAVAVVGVGALLGKVSWGMAINVGIGVAVIFGATAIVINLGGTHHCFVDTTGPMGLINQGDSDVLNHQVR